MSKKLRRRVRIMESRLQRLEAIESDAKADRIRQLNEYLPEGMTKQ